ncbi:MAG: SDR family NAD(P)-dependent oxidoreductase [Ardenticatenaceae bacterium]|nr:SDR family NAD(P)-dependent oxidoreductase [Ardenticatenaceae bacterium]MCB8987083.1 SDR family NAD(P)-dependent oxidoreductase [Ardenticatenaceae bacterium]
MSNSSSQSSELSPLKRAYLAIEKLQQQVKDLEKSRQDPIAVIGIGCRFPGGANTPDAFWQLLRAGTDAIREVPAERWDIDAYYDPDPDKPGMMSTRWAGFMDGVDQFDPQLFNISPREATTLDPQQRLLLEVSWEALEHAGLALDQLSGSATGVFTGITGNDYAQMQLADGGINDIDTYYGSGVGHSMASGRISYVLGLQGPSVSIDTACSSSLVAIHLACQSLRSGECRLALAGGANTILVPETSVALSKFHMMAPDGRCKTFDARADGFVRGEGCGVVVLKRLSDALADGDNILAVVRGTAVNQDGPSSGLTAPHGPAQEAVIKAALQNAGLQPDDISYVETHGTGTALGDPIEVQALGATLGVNRPADQPLLLGSVKTNIGHLESTAGVAGFIKLVLAVHHGEIPPNLHFETPNPLIPWNDWPLVVPTALTPWLAEQRIGAVSSFGFSGTNAHIIVGEAEQVEPKTVEAERLCHLLTLSAQTETALTQLAGRWADHLAAAPHTNLADAAFTANNGRAHLPYRLALAASTTAEAQQKLAVAARSETGNGVTQGRTQTTDRPKIAFLFTGQGAQYPGMGRQLYETQPVFRAALDQCDEILRPYLPRPLLSVLFDETDDSIHQTQYTQPALFAIEYALFALWQSWGVQPTAVMGHSVGEYVAACVAGVFSLEDGLKLIAARGRLMQALPAGGAMAAIFSDEATVRAAIAAFTDVVSIAAVNGPQNVVISGKETAVSAILDQLAAKGIKAKPLTVSHAFHSPLMEPMLAEFAAVAGEIAFTRPRLRVISNVTGQPALGDTLTRAAYWRDHVRQPVQFQAAMNWLHENRYGLFLEVGPHPTLLGMGRRCLPDDAAGLWLPSLRQGRDDWPQILASLGDLFVYGVDVDWAGFDGPYARRKLRLPTYPFQHRRYWLPERRRSAARPSAGHPLLGSRLRSAAQLVPFEALLNVETVPVLHDHRVHGLAILPATGYIEMMLAAATAVFGPGVHAIEGLTIHEPLVVADDETRVVQTLVTPAAAGPAAVQIFSQREADGPDAPWLLHADGRLQPHQTTPTPNSESPDALRAACPETVSAETHYAKLHDLGLHFGPSLHGVVQMWRRDGEAVGQIILPAAGQTENGRYQIHPALLDACLQVMAAAIPADLSESDIFMPLGVDRFVLYRQPEGPVWSHATLALPDAGLKETLTAQVRVLDENGRLLAEAHGLHLKRASRAALLSRRADDLADWLYRVEWQPAPLLAEETAVAASFPPPAAVAEGVEPEAKTLFARYDLAAYQALAPLLDELSADSILAAWQQLGWQPVFDAFVTPEGLAAELAVLPEHQRLMGRLLEILAEDGWLGRAEAGWRLQKIPPQLTAVSLENRWQTLARQFPQFDAEIDIAWRCSQGLAAALSGQADPLQLLFPGGDLSSTSKVYQESPFARTYSGLVGQVVAEMMPGLPAERPLRVLEIGAGTGGTTAFVLPQLPADRSRYVFTDMSPLFLDRARQKCAAFPFVDYRLLNIENDPAAQGFAAQDTFDLIVAANVIHATADLRQTLSHVQQLLAPGGLLLLLEMTHPIRWIDLSFGLTDGWWRFVDADVRPSYPLLNREGWLSLLADVGFEAGTAVPHREDLLSEQAILLARKPVAPGGDIAGNWLLFADERGVGAQLAAQLQAQGARCTLVHTGAAFHDEGERMKLNPANLDGLDQVLTQRPYHHIVHLWSLDAPDAGLLSPEGLETAVAAATGSVLHLVQAVAAADLSVSPRLWLVTAAAQDVNGRAPQVAQSPLWGLAKTIGLELPELRPTCLDLDADAPINAAALLAEMRANDTEPQVAFRQGERLAARLVRHQPAPTPADEPQQLTISQRGVLDNLSWQPLVRRAPGAHEVEIRVLATGLNFKDVLNTLGMYPGDPGPLGGECAGVVTAVGPHVTEFRVGDAVLAVAGGSFRTHVLAPVHLVAHKPPRLSFAAAAATPIPYLTAAFTLNHLGHMQPGDKVLIHAAAGGVGMAAVHLAQRAGATIFATAGSPEKRAFLRDLGIAHVMDSRSLDFADEVLELTGGSGVDLVLNSLADEFAWQSMRVLAVNGRFLEIGKRGILSPDEATQQKPHAAYHIVDWGETAQQDPALISALFRQIVADIGAGELPPLPVRTFAREETIDAFRFMAQARHIGKIAVTQPGVQPVTIRSDGAYLVTGGLRGLGLLVAEWLAAQGARHLALVGRRRPDQQATELIARLEADGVQVYTAQVDVTNASQMSALFSDMADCLPPLRGVIHSAGTLADGVLLQQEWSQFARVLGPKVTGAWQLHLLTERLPLDFFVLFSSIASLTGAAGQGAHAAANVFLDALAQYRRSQGLPGLSIDWGAWTEVGAAVRHGVFERTMAQGIGAIEPAQGLRLLGELLPEAAPQVAVMPVDWTNFRRKFGHLPFFADLMRQPEKAAVVGETAVSPSHPNLMTQLAEAAANRRRAIMLAFVETETRQVLGLDESDALDERAALSDMGLDSLMAVELKNRLSTGLTLLRPLPATLVFDYPTTAAITEYLLENVALGSSASADDDAPVAEEAEQPGNGRSPLDSLDDIDALAALSDDEVDRLFAEMGFSEEPYDE